jgi:WD40 repeat protein
LFGNGVPRHIAHPRQGDEGKGRDRFMINIILRRSFSPNGKLMQSCSENKTIRLWDAASGKARSTLELGITITSLPFSTLGQYLKTNRGVLDVSSLLEEGQEAVVKLLLEKGAKKPKASDVHVL